MPFTLPADVAGRPIAIEGAGTLGRRIASVYVAGGTDVRLHDASPKQLEGAIQHVTDNAVGVRRTLDLHPANGSGAAPLSASLRTRSEVHGWSWSRSRKISS
jgi:3-hydroxyacyl-CoA dehydrogenase